MARWQNLKWMMVWSLAVGGSVVRAEEPATLPREIREVQRSLGGPVVDQFPTLQPNPATPLRPTAQLAPRPSRDQPGMWPNWSSEATTRVMPAVAAAPDERLRVQVNSLRETAAQLDGSANRLESLELYQQADALRNVAQRLRMEARSMGSSGPTYTPAEAPQWLDPAADDSPRQGVGGRAERRRERRERSIQPSPEPTPVEPTAEATDN